MGVRLTARMKSFAPSATMTISAKVTELRAAGKDVIGFSAGEPDFDTPEHVKEAAIKAIRDGHNGYTAVAGTTEAKTAIMEHVQRTLGIDYKANEVILSLGAKHSLYNISQVLFEAGDEVIVLAPYWVTYPDQVSLAGAKPVYVDCPADNNFNPDPDEIRKKTTSATRAIIVNSPSNPTGAIFREEVLRAIADLVVEKDMFLISDEVYDHIIYDGVKHVSPATFGDEVKKRTLLVNGYSKTFSMTGWRLGYVLGDAEVVKAMGKLQGQVTSNPVTPVQFAGIAALKDFSFLDERVAEFKKRRDVIVSALNALEGVACNLPQGAFYVLPDFTGWIGRTIDGETIKDSVHLTTLLIEKALIAPVPGAAFGAENFLRFSYATSMEQIEEGMARLKAFSERLR